MKSRDLNPEDHIFCAEKTSSGFEETRAASWVNVFNPSKLAGFIAVLRMNPNLYKLSDVHQKVLTSIGANEFPDEFAGVSPARR
jgi:hypothetical protein